MNSARHGLRLALSLRGDDDRQLWAECGSLSVDAGLSPCVRPLDCNEIGDT